LLGQLVKTRIETFARLRNERPAQLFQANLKIPSVANLPPCTLSKYQYFEPLGNLSGTLPT